tara:strand:+ start:528 stop:1226 length:699 start_codon:yes stop_codon:yes gene_type:complete
MKTVIVVGMARSGTSMVSGILHQLGVNMNPVDNPSYQNPKGSFEDSGFIHLTVAMKQDIEKGMRAGQIKKKYTPQIKELARKRSANKLWGFKSALVHYSLPYILPHLTNPHLVVNYRCPLHNAESWKLHKKVNYGDNNTPIIDALQAVALENKKIVAAVRRHQDMPMVFTSYEYIKDTPIKEAEKFAKLLGVKMTPQLRKAVVNFIDPNYSTLKISLKESGLPRKHMPKPKK